MKASHILVVTCSLFFCGLLQAQSPGLIVRPAGGNGVTSLNPNGDGYSSATTAGFTSDDITGSELAYKVVPAAITEPTGDLATGPSGGFTDIVTSVDGSGFYLYKDATNIYFRLRIGGIISGSKGYSVLIDTDGKMGSSGLYADPNYVAPSGSSPGNPGFEYEVVLETNFQVVVYNIDGRATPGSPVATYSLSSNSQISVALSTDSNNPDYFYDWFIPLTAIGSPSSIRTAVTTVTSPNSALQGTRSDIYGIDDGAYSNTASAWQAVVDAQSPVGLTSFGTINPTCTAAPVLNSPITTGSGITVSGTWTRMDASKPSTATITLYKNGVSAGTTTVSTGSTWNITVATIASGDVLYAMAQATGESQCLQSNNVTASTCTSTLATPVLTCASTKGISGTMTTGSTISVYQVPVTSASPTSNLVSTGTNLTYPTSASFAFMSNGCSGSPVLATGTYMVIATNGGCTSAPRFECITSGSSSTVGLSSNSLSITQPVYPYQTSVSGSGSASGDILRLYKNGVYKATVTATGASFSFTGLTLSAGDQLQIYSQSSSACMTQSPVFTVSCYTQPPVITGNTTGNLLTGATSISGTSAYSGATVQLYKGTSPSGTAVGSPVTTNSSRSWTVSVTALVSGNTYYATQAYGSCTSASSSSVTVLTPASCPTISGSYTDASTTVNGTMPAAFTGTIRLYEDGALIGSKSISSATTWNITVSSNTLYYNGVLKATAQATGGAESSGCSTVTVGCTSPTTPTVSPSVTTINEGQTVTFNVSNVAAGNWYALLDNSGVSYATSSYQTGTGSFSMTSNTFATAGTYNLRLSADALTGCPASYASTAVTVSGALPVHFITVAAKKEGSAAVVTWTTVNEVNVRAYKVEKSLDGRSFQAVGTVAPGPSFADRNSYSFTDNTGLRIGRTYYRILEVDDDGSYRYSDVVSFANNPANTLVITPNPASDAVTISLTAAQSGNAVIGLLSIDGKTMIVRRVVLRQGGNTIRIDNLGNMPRGNYIVKLSSLEDITYYKLVLQ